jgi:DNA invertase Pin-like site-specific DNA recombinase
MPASAPTGRPSTPSLRSYARRDAPRFTAKATGARADRRELLKFLKALAPGDVVTVTRIDRLARSTFRPVRHRQADRGRQGAISLTGGAVGRHRYQHGRLMIAVLGGLAGVERDLIRTRTAEGRSRAKARMGRPPKLTPQQQKEARRWRAEGGTLKELAKSYNVGRATISKLR